MVAPDTASPVTNRGGKGAVVPNDSSPGTSGGGGKGATIDCKLNHQVNHGCGCGDGAVKVIDNLARENGGMDPTKRKGRAGGVTNADPLRNRE